ncbi:MAG: GntR family transcriptional regulator [Beutenbergiaceae bacterium]
MTRRSTPFDKRTLRQRCTTYVRDLIITGQMRPGDHLVETKLADDLGVSRGTLRESLRPLEVEGLLVADGRGHMLVRVMTAEEIREVFLVRSALESLAAAILAGKDDRDDVVRELGESLHPLRDDNLDFGQQIEFDLGFHELLCRLTGNGTLLRSWQQLIGQIEMMIIAAGPEIASSRMRYEGHIEIVDAIASGDVTRVQAVVAAHMDEFATKYVHDAAAQPT